MLLIDQIKIKRNGELTIDFDNYTGLDANTFTLHTDKFILDINSTHLNEIQELIEEIFHLNNKLRNKETEGTIKISDKQLEYINKRQKLNFLIKDLKENELCEDTFNVICENNNRIEEQK